MPVNLQSSPGTSSNPKKEKVRGEGVRGEGVRRMPTNSRPPLSHRIRASFEGKKSHDSDHGNFYEPADPEVVRQAIDHAISGDAFQAGIATHIANMLKPQIKMALDTIEPLVNAVLEHELLLKKTNNIVEHVLLKLDTMVDEDGPINSNRARLSVHGALTSHPISISDLRSEDLRPPTGISHPSTRGRLASFSNEPTPSLNRHATYTVGKLSEISESLDLSNHKLGKVVEGIAEINSLLTSDERLESVKETSEKNCTNTSAMQAQLDQLQENVRVIIARIGADLGTNVKAINDHLASGTFESEKALAPTSGGQDAELLQAISSELEGLKQNFDSSTSSHGDHLVLLKMQITALQSALDNQKVLLGEIKEGDNSAEVLAGIQKSNESHGAHTAVLAELKERNVQPVDASTQPKPNPEDTEVLRDILSEVQKSNESHEKQIVALENIKELDRSADILTETQKSNELHASHAAALETMKDSSTAPPSIDPAGLETKLGSIIETSSSILAEVQKSNDSHVSHAAALDQIKSLSIQSPGSNVASAGVDVGGLDKSMGSIIEILDKHATVLDEIKSKDGSIPGEIDAKASDGHFASVLSLLEAHNAILQEIKTKEMPTTDLSPIISMLEAQKVNLDEINAKGSQTADFTPITSFLEAHSAKLDEIKAKDGTTSIDFSQITSTLDSHRAVLDKIESRDIHPPSAPAIFDMVAFDKHFTSIAGMLAVHTAALDEIRVKIGSSNSVMPPEVNTGILNKHFDSIASMLEAHAVKLDEMKSRDIAPGAGSAVFDTAAFDVHFNSLNSMLQSHTLALDELKSKNHDDSSPAPKEDNTAFESLEAHIISIKGSLDAHMALLGDLKNETLAKNDMDAMVVDNMVEPHIIAMKDTLDTHTAILGELQSNNASTNAGSSETDKESLPQILETLNFHTNLLTGINHADVSDEILTALHELKDSSSTAFNALKELDVSDEILTALHTCNDSQGKLDKSLQDLQKAVVTSVSSEQNGERSIASDELVTANGLNISDLETQISTVIATLECQNVVLGEIKDITKTGIEIQNSHTISLSEIKDAAKASNNAHNTHTATLSVISRAHSTQITSLGELKEAMQFSDDSHSAHSGILGEIKDAITSSNEAHTTHTSTLGELKEAINTSNQSQTSILGEIMEAHTSHSTTLGEIKETTTASNESYTSHTLLLNEIKDSTAAVKDINEVLNTHTEVLESIKEDDRSKHDEVRGDIEGLKKVVEENANKYDENLEKHGEMIREHHDGLKGVVAGLAVGGVLGVGVSRALKRENAEEGGEDDENGLMGGKVSEEAVHMELKAQAEEERALDEEATPKEHEAPEPTIEEITPVIEESAEVLGDSEAQPEPEIEVEEEEGTVEEEAPEDKESEPEAISEEPEVRVEHHEDVSTSDIAQSETELEQTIEPEVIVEKEAPVEELLATEPNLSTQEVEVEEPASLEEESVPAPIEITDEALVVETQEAEENVPSEKSATVEDNILPDEPVPINSEVVSEPSPVREENAEDSIVEPTEPTIREISENREIQVAEVLEEPSAVQEPAAAEKVIEASEVAENAEANIPEVMEETQISETDPVSKEDGAPELFNEEPNHEHIADAEEVLVEEEIVGVEGSEEERDGESKGDQVQEDRETLDNDLKAVEEAEFVADEKEEPTQEAVPAIEAREVQISEEEKSAEIPTTEVLLENSSNDLQQSLPEEVGGNVSSAEEDELRSIDDIPTTIEDNTAMPNSDVEIQVPIPEPSDEISAASVELPLEHEITEQGSEDPSIDMQTELEQPIDDEEKVETEHHYSSEKDVPTKIMEKSIEPEDDIPEPALEDQKLVTDSIDRETPPVEDQEKALESEVLQQNDEEAPIFTEETVLEPPLEIESESIVESATPVSESNSREKTLIENEEGAGEPQVSENVEDGVPTQSSEDTIPEVTLNTETSMDQDQPAVESEESSTEPDVSRSVENSEPIPSSEVEEKAYEFVTQIAGDETKPTEVEESPIEISIDPTIENETLFIESTENEEIPVQTEENSLGPESRAIVEEKVEGLEVLTSVPVGLEKVAVKKALQESVQDEAFENESLDSMAKLSEEVERSEVEEELPESSEQSTSELPIQELVTETQAAIPNDEELLDGKVPEESTLEPEEKHESPTYMPETEDTQIVTYDGEVPIPADAQPLESETKRQIPESESPATEPEVVINEDPEDRRVREEIAALNAEMARIIVEAEAEAKSDELVVEETNDAEDGHSLDNTERVGGDEQLEIGRAVEEHVDIPSEQPQVERVIEEIPDVSEAPGVSREPVLPEHETSVERINAVEASTDDGVAEGNQEFSSMIKDDPEVEENESIYSQDAGPELNIQDYSQEQGLPSRETSFQSGDLITGSADTALLEREPEAEPEATPVDSTELCPTQEHNSSHIDPQNPFSGQVNGKQLELEPEALSAIPSIAQYQSFEPYSDQDIHVKDHNDSASERPMTPTKQTTHREYIPPTPPTQLNTQLSTETFPLYDESRRSSTSQAYDFNLGLPMRSTERVGTIPETSEFEIEPEYNDSIRSSPSTHLPSLIARKSEPRGRIPDFGFQRGISDFGRSGMSDESSRLPDLITRNVEAGGRTLEFESEREFGGYDESVRGSDALRMQSESPGPVHVGRDKPEFEDEREYFGHDDSLRFSVSSRLPSASPRPINTGREASEFGSERDFSTNRYDERPRPTESSIASSRYAENARSTHDFDDEPTTSRYDEPLRSPQSSRLSTSSQRQINIGRDPPEYGSERDLPTSRDDEPLRYSQSSRLSIASQRQASTNKGRETPDFERGPEYPSHSEPIQPLRQSHSFASVPSRRTPEPHSSSYSIHGYESERDDPTTFARSSQEYNLGLRTGSPNTTANPSFTEAPLRNRNIHTESETESNDSRYDDPELAPESVPVKPSRSSQRSDYGSPARIATPSREASPVRSSTPVRSSPVPASVDSPRSREAREPGLGSLRGSVRNLLRRFEGSESVTSSQAASPAPSVSAFNHDHVGSGSPHRGFGREVASSHSQRRGGEDGVSEERDPFGGSGSQVGDGGLFGNQRGSRYE